MPDVKEQVRSADARMVFPLGLREPIYNQLRCRPAQRVTPRLASIEYGPGRFAYLSSSLQRCCRPTQHGLSLHYACRQDALQLPNSVRRSGPGLGFGYLDVDWQDRGLRGLCPLHEPWREKSSVFAQPSPETAAVTGLATKHRAWSEGRDTDPVNSATTRATVAGELAELLEALTCVRALAKAPARLNRGGGGGSDFLAPPLVVRRSVARRRVRCTTGLACAAQLACCLLLPSWCNRVTTTARSPPCLTD
eukprot:scaffold2058_cov403-Prasinococcus_capsulatus_cf.AAC.4